MDFQEPCEELECVVLPGRDSCRTSKELGAVSGVPDQRGVGGFIPADPWLGRVKHLFSYCLGQGYRTV